MQLPSTNTSLSYNPSNQAIRFEVDRTYGGESYRPSDRNEPLRSSYRGARSPPRRRSPPPYTDRYAERRRSRSPAYVGRIDTSYRPPRSPPRRGYSPRRDERPRSPLPRARRYSRSPVRPRSPLAYRRDPSPIDRRPRSPPARQRRLLSPREQPDRRPYSPPRDSRSRYGNDDDDAYRTRRRSRSPLSRRPITVSRPQSPISSRRSSPPMHSERHTQSDSRPRSPVYRDRRPLVTQRNGSYRDSPQPRRAFSPRPRSPPRDPPSYRSPPRKEHVESPLPTTRQTVMPFSPPAQPPTSSYRSEELRAPQPQAFGAYDTAPKEPPSGPASSRPVSMSAHNRPSSASVLSAPTRPRGGGGFYRGDSREHPYGGPPAHRGGRPPSAVPYQTSRYGYDAHSPEKLPNGARSGLGGPPFSSYDGSRHAPPFRTNNSSSTTYPRTQRFNTHLTSLPNVIPGGKALPSADPVAAKKLAQLEEDANKLRKQIDDKQKDKRAGLREWETRERESQREGFRSEMAEAQLEGFSEVLSGQAF